MLHPPPSAPTHPSADELERVLPVVPSSQQAAFFSGSATDGVQRWGASLALTVLFSKVGRVGGGAACLGCCRAAAGCCDNSGHGVSQ